MTKARIGVNRHSLKFKTQSGGGDYVRKGLQQGWERWEQLMAKQSGETDMDGDGTVEVWEIGWTSCSVERRCRGGFKELFKRAVVYHIQNKRCHPYKANARLDRVLGNRELKRRLPQIEVIHGYAHTSDHLPLIVKTCKRKVCYSDPHFRYESMWHRHEKFSGKLEVIWKDSIKGAGLLADVLERCADGLGKWNTKEFGNVKKKVKEIKKSLQDLSKIPRTNAVKETEKRLDRGLG
ncbi:hypothetical protein QQ045_012387 [Rhodiola kirilowii]